MAAPDLYDDNPPELSADYEPGYDGTIIEPGAGFDGYPWDER